MAQVLCQRYVDELTALYDEAVVDDPGGRDAIVSKVVDALDDFSARHPGFGPLMLACRKSADLQVAGETLHASLVHHVEQVIAARRHTVAPARRRVVAQTCASVLRSVMDEVGASRTDEREAMIAELKLILSSYLAVALPRG